MGLINILSFLANLMRILVGNIRDQLKCLVDTEQLCLIKSWWILQTAHSRYFLNFISNPFLILFYFSPIMDFLRQKSQACILLILFLEWQKRFGMFTFERIMYTLHRCRKTTTKVTYGTGLFYLMRTLGRLQNVTMCMWQIFRTFRIWKQKLAKWQNIFFINRVNSQFRTL